MMTSPPGGLVRVARRIAEAGPPGVHLSVATSRGQRFEVCVGDAQREPDNVPLTEAHAHDLGSVTKIVGTTAMLAALVSAGTLHLSDTVGRFISGLPAELADATLIDLLRHRAGLWEWWPTYLTDEDPLRTIAALPLRYPPRTGRHYSDLGFILLGRVITVAQHQSLPDAYRELVLEPNGIRGLAYAGPPDGHPAAASSFGDRIERHMVASGKPYPTGVDGSSYHGWREHVLIGEVNDGNAFHSFGGAAGHAGLFGTATGLHHVARLFLRSLRQADPWSSAPQFFAAGPDNGQRLGFRSRVTIMLDCATTVFEHPGFPGVGVAIIPKHAASVVLATNRLHVRWAPAAFEPLWQQALSAAHQLLHESGAT